MRKTLQIVYLLLLPLLGNGCATRHLWTDSALDEWNEPAPNPNLRLFDDERRHAILVMYDEYSERRSTTRTRAFFLEPNQASLAQHTRPRFGKVDVARNLPSVPVLSSMPLVPPESLYAVAITNSAAFTVFSDECELGSYELPVYNDGVGQVERVALTPVAVTMDATVIGGVLGITYLYATADEDVDLGWWYQ